MPAVSEPSLPHTWRPLGVRLAFSFFGGLLVVVCVAGWYAVGAEVRSRVTIYQQITRKTGATRITDAVEKAAAHGLLD